MTLKFRFHSNVNHVKITVFAGLDKDNLANCGQLTMLHGEWQALHETLAYTIMYGNVAAPGRGPEVIFEEEKHI